MRRRQTVIIGGVKHWACGGKCKRILPESSFNMLHPGQPQSYCRRCQSNYNQARQLERGPLRHGGGLSEEKAEASDSYLETLEEFQAWASKRGKPWKAEIVKVLAERMERQAEKSHG